MRSNDKTSEVKDQALKLTKAIYSNSDLFATDKARKLHQGTRITSKIRNRMRQRENIVHRLISHTTEETRAKSKNQKRGYTMRLTCKAII